MEICQNCRNREAEYNCDTCRRAYCEQCDLYIHSFSSKNRHVRTKFLKSSPFSKFETARNNYTTDKNGFYVYTGNTSRNYSSLYKNNRNPLLERPNENFNLSPINSQVNNYYENLSPKSNNINKTSRAISPNKNDIPNKTYNLNSNDEYNYNYKYNKLSLSPPQLSANDTLNETSQSLKKNKSFNSSFGLGNLISYDEKIRLMKKISQLNCELSNARSDIDQKIDILNEHMNNVKEANKKEMNELNYKNINEINIISSQKDTLIKHLKEVMKDQEETIQKLLRRKKNLEEEINDSKYLIEKYTTEKENYIKEKENNEILYKEKKNLLEQRHESEVQKIRNDYDSELDRLLTKYGQTKSEYLNEIKKGNEIIEDFRLRSQKEADLISSDIQNLQNENDIKNKEQEDIINKNNELKKSNDDYNAKYDEEIAKYKNNKDEREKMRKSFSSFQNELQIRKRENDKLHRIKYGRFSFNK